MSKKVGLCQTSVTASCAPFNIETEGHHFLRRVDVRSRVDDSSLSNTRERICRRLSEGQRRCFVGCSAFLGSINSRGRVIFLPPISPRRLQTSRLPRPSHHCDA